MTENVRKRTSKWDLISETPVSAEIEQENTQPGNSGDLHPGRQYSDRTSSRRADSQAPRWHDKHRESTISERYHVSKPSNLEPGNAAVSKDCSEIAQYSNRFDMDTAKKEDSSCEPISSNRTEQRDGNANRAQNSAWSGMDAANRNRFSCEISSGNRTEHKDNVGWGTALGQSYSTSMSPRRNTCQQQSRSISPKRRWSKSRRSQSRSRSRSPIRSSRKDTEGWNDRNRLGPRGSFPPCRDFVAGGRCRRGSQCRYPHEDGGRRQSDRYYDPGVTDSRESQYERERSSGHDRGEYFTESMEEGDYSRDKLPYRHGSHYDEDRNKRDFHGNQKSAELCYDFTRGRCNRGSTCRYVHDASHDGGSHGKDWASRESTFDRGGRELSSRHEAHKSSDIPCKFFAEGRCRNGEKCRFSHQGLVQSHPEGGVQDNKWGSGWGDENERAQSGSKWIDHDAYPDEGKTSNWINDNSAARTGAPSTLDRQGFTSFPRNPQHQNPEDLEYLGLPKEPPQIVLPAQEKKIDHESLKQQNPCDETFPSTLVGENAHVQQHPASNAEATPHEDGNMAVNSSKPPDEVNFYANNQLGLAAVPAQNFSHRGPSQCTVLQSPNSQSSNSIGQNQQVVRQTSFSDPSQQHVYSLTLNLQSQSTASHAPPIAQNLNFSGQNQQVPLPSLGGQNQNIYSLPSSGQVIYPALNGQSFDTSEQSQQVPTQPLRPPAQMQLGLEESAPKPDARETKSSDANSNHPVEVVTSEQIAQITNISASLAQIFGNGPQLPQLYAALNPPNTTGVPPSHPYPQPNPMIAPVPSAALLTLENHTSWSELQYDPVSDGMKQGKADKDSLHLGLSEDSVGQKNTGKEIQTTLNLAPNLVIDGPHNIGNSKGVDLEEKLKNANNESTKVDLSGDNESREVNGITMSQKKKQQKTGPSEEGDADFNADDDGKRNKDIKGIRMFKYTLAVFVKEMLKPTWKEGNMSKEAHKTIVKKVVDKVTGAMQSNMPQTQEKIDLYVSHSKPKLSKLVQAYVEKYSKI